MSKVAKGIGRAIGKVVDGAKKLVKKVAKSKVFKVIAVAAAIYFTGGAALGAMGGASAASAAGTSVLAGAAKGAIAGLGSAGAGISSAWGNLIGGNIAGAGSSLAGGMTGAGAAGSSAISGGVTSAMSTGFNATKGLLNPAAGGAAPGTASTFAATPGGPPITSAPIGSAATTGNSIASMPVDKLLEMPMAELQKQAGSLSAGQMSALKQAGIELTAKPGLLRTMVTSPYALPMAMQIGGNAMAGKAETEYVDEKESEDRERYNRNIGTRLFVSNN